MYFDWDRKVVVEELVAAEEEQGRPESNPAEAWRQELAETAQQEEEEEELVQGLET